MNKRSTLIVHCLTVVLVLLTAVACGGGDPEGPALTPTISAQRMQLETDIATWKALGFDSYLVRVTHRRPSWDPQVMDLRVMGGEASFDDFACFPERTCFERTLEPQDFTLDAIYEEARAIADGNDFLQISYNEEFGFPRILNSPELSWEISNFRPIR